MLLCMFQGHLREAKCHLAMGELVTALRCYHKVLELDPGNTAAKNEVNAPSCNGSTVHDLPVGQGDWVGVQADSRFVPSQ